MLTNCLCPRRTRARGSRSGLPRWGLKAAAHAHNACASKQCPISSCGHLSLPSCLPVTFLCYAGSQSIRSKHKRSSPDHQEGCVRKNNLQITPLLMCQSTETILSWSCLDFRMHLQQHSLKCRDLAAAIWFRLFAVNPMLAQNHWILLKLTFPPTPASSRQELDVRSQTHEWQGLLLRCCRRMF